MNDGNWTSYIFIIILVFGRDGAISGTELWVLIATILAVLLSSNGCFTDFFTCPNQTGATAV